MIIKKSKFVFLLKNTLIFIKKIKKSKLYCIDDLIKRRVY